MEAFMRYIEPTEAQFNEFLSQPDHKPLVMINLLKFKKLSENSEAGIDVYNRYLTNVAPLLESVGGRLLWMGDVDQVLIGSERNTWDRVMLVEYPSKKAFLEMISNPEYQKIHKDRDSGLETSALLPSKTILSILNQ
jgi:uncharacterized protein (DUF1330 family)